MSNFISYWDLLKNRDQFRKSGTNSGSEFNLYDTPGHKYFKIFFYFDNGDSVGEGGLDNGLLAPTWLDPNATDKTFYMYNSAWSYLQMNDEVDRAGLLENFVNLLSNISSESPWYFSEISGLDTALERKQPMSNTFSIEETRPKISIKCLPDSFDDRIGTLLDLYRTIVWDWSTKREVLPANLRKFDMGIFIFETATSAFHVRKKDNSNQTIDSLTSSETAIIGDTDVDNKTSYKYIELHNCEIDYNSSKNLYSSLNNKDGFAPEYTIDIHFDDCYESRHNEFMAEEFGDIIISDFLTNNQKSKNSNLAESYRESEFVGHNGARYGANVGDKLPIAEVKQPREEASKKSAYEEKWSKLKPKGADSRLEGYPKPPVEKSGFLANMVDQLVSTGLDKVNSLLKKAVLGNLYTFSLTKIGNQINALASGDIITSARNVGEYIRDAKSRNQKDEFGRTQLFEPTEYAMGKPKGNLSGEVNPTVQLGTLSPSFMEPTEYEMGKPSGSLPGEVKPSPTYQKSEMFPRGTQAWTKSSGGEMFEKKKIKPSVKYIGDMFEGSSIANNL